MLDQQTLRSIAEARLEDAQILFDNQRYDGAAYICGYAVELALKARICDTLQVQEYPEKEHGFKTHNLDLLLLLSGRSFIKKDQAHFTIWSSVVDKWQPEMRYRAIGIISPADARTLIEATKALLLLL